MMFNKNKFRRSVAAFLTGSFAFAASSFASVAQEQDPVAHNPVDHTQILKLDDYTSHPLAGSEVVIEIEVKDALGQKGQSRQVTTRLPAYNFTNSVNRELAEMRKTLALDWSKAAEISIALDHFITEQSMHIKNTQIIDDLKAIQRVLARSASIDELDKIVSQDMWQVMMALEEDMLSEAEKNLRDTQEALRRALEEGMSPEDLQKLVDEAQKAMEEFLKEQLEKSQDQSSDQQGENGENSDQQQMSDEEKQALEDMLKMLEEMKKMMEELGLSPEKQAEMMQQMMQNMSQGQNAQQMMQSQMSMQQQLQQMQQAQEMSKDLEELIKQQQELMDESADMSDVTDEELKKIQEQLLEIAKELDRQIDAQTDIESQKDPDDEQAQKNLKILKNDNHYVETQLDMLQEKQDKGEQITSSWTEIIIKKFTEIQQRLQEMRGNDQQDPQQQQQSQQPGQENQTNQPDANNLEQQLQQLMDQLRQMGQRQQDMQSKIQEMIKQMQQMNMHPKDLMEANEHMGNSARDLKNGKPADSVPSQNQAIQSMQSAQQKLQQMMQQMMMGAGAPQAGYQGPQEEAPHAPLGRSNPNEIIGINPADAVNTMRKQRDEIRNHLDQGNLPAEQRQYLERLLNGLTPLKPVP